MEIRARYVLMGLFTLAVLLVGFGFVYWLKGTAGFSSRTVYAIRFDQPVPGLLRGSAVLFNGIRVGEVTALRLNADAPAEVSVEISVDATAPVREDTKVELAFQGLTGGAAVLLKGGSIASPTLTPGPNGVRALTAPPGATQDMTQSARVVLQRLDGILQENAEPLKETMAGLSTFSAALARNSDKLDSIVAGLAQLAGAGSKANPISYDLSIPRDFPGLKAPGGTLTVAEPTALVALQTQRILQQVKDGRQPGFEGTQWSDSLPVLVQTGITRGFEAAGLANVGKDSAAGGASLQIDIREFSLSPKPDQAGMVELSARLLGADGRVLGTKTFRAQAPVASDEAAAAAAAIGAAFVSVSREMIGWTLGLLGG